MLNNYIYKTFPILFLLIFILSCNDNRSLSDKIEEIKEIGNTNPTLALAMLDSLNVIIPNQPTDVMNKFFLVRLRVQDKAYIAATSDIVA